MAGHQPYGLRLRALSANTTAQPVVAGLWAGGDHARPVERLRADDGFCWNCGGLSAFTLNVLLVCLAGLLVILPVILMVLLIRRVARAGVQSSIQEDYQQEGVPLPGSWSPMKLTLAGGLWRPAN